MDMHRAKAEHFKRLVKVIAKSHIMLGALKAQKTPHLSLLVISNVFASRSVEGRFLASVCKYPIWAIK